MPLEYIAAPISKLSGSLTVPGDKSISHRSIMLGAIADGITTVQGFLQGADCLATMHAFKAMGIRIDGPENGRVRIHGSGLQGLQKPSGILDLGNSGTSIRLLMGLLAGQNFAVTLTGDASLRKRPMERVAAPLRQMGANIALEPGGLPPVVIRGNPALHAIDYVLPMASAQVKSAVLLAGLYSSGVIRVTEPAPARDHTERMLRGFGVEIHKNNATSSMQGGQRLQAADIVVPGDISSAAFFMVAASVIPNAKITLKNIGVNPTRTGCLEILKLMGARFTLQNQREVCGEPVADLQVETAKLQGIEIPENLIPLAIDEFPILFIAAACAKGTTILRGAAELRVKESDRIRNMAEGLQTLGIACEEFADGIAIRGGTIQGGSVNSHSDHRIAMAFSIAGLKALAPVRVQDCANVQTSFPNFIEAAQSLGADITARDI